MQETGFDWNHSYVIPPACAFAPYPRVDCRWTAGRENRASRSRETGSPLLLAFARAQTAAEAYQAATEEWEADRGSSGSSSRD